MRIAAVAMFLAVTCCRLLSGQSWTSDDIVDRKAQGVTEDDIFQELQTSGFRLALDEKSFSTLEDCGFSQAFIRKVKDLAAQRQGKTPQSRPRDTVPVDLPQSKVGPKYCKICVEVWPAGAGEVEITPAPDGQGRYESGAEVTLTPRARGPFLFECWQGNLQGYRPVSIRLDRDLSATACFKKVSAPPPPPKIGDPEEFKDTRRAGYVYHGNVVAQIEGRGEHKDWGFNHEVEYKYLYQVKYTSNVISNDGLRIAENRTFDAVQEALLVSRYRFRLDIREDLAPVKHFLDKVSYGLMLRGNPQKMVTGLILRVSTELARSLEIAA